jgi:peptide-methionine (S)-S-oxide reductase
MLEKIFLTTCLLLVGMISACSQATASNSIFPNPVIDEPLTKESGKQTVVLAGGCFWGVEAVFEHVKGVISVKSGYAGGSVAKPSYEEVSSGNTGHAESVQITYDPSKISYGQLLKVFFAVAHDPTQSNRQGPDVGTQYRSAIFVSTDEQKRIASAYITQLDNAKIFKTRIVTEITQLNSFNEAESYHQNYLANHPNDPYIVVNDQPKLDNLRKSLPELYLSR